jgi:hypothetical protein
VLRVSCILQEFKFPPKFFGYLTGHHWGAVVISNKDGVSSGEGARVQREFRHVYQEAAPDANRIKAWCNKFLETGIILKGQGEGQRVSD